MKQLLSVLLMLGLSCSVQAGLDAESNPELYQELLEYCQSYEEEASYDEQSVQECIDEEYQYMLEDQTDTSDEEWVD